MNQDEKLKAYLKFHLIKSEVEDGFCEIGEKLYKIIDSKEKLFDEDFKFLPKIDEDGAIYEFGGRWYIQENEETEMKEVLYLEKAKQKLPTPHFLGIHSGNEMLNGVGMYADWIKKAKFLGVKTLGICETNSLAGVIDFQEQCKENDIKPVFGMSFKVSKEEKIYSIKAYIKNFQGWQNLLKINKKINVDGQLTIKEDYLLDNFEGLVLVIDPKKTDFNICPRNEGMFFQLDTVIFENEFEDSDYALNLEKFIKSELKPVFITDAFYIDQRDYVAREMLWKIAKKFDKRSKNQYFKNNDQYAKELIEMFEEGNSSWIKLYKEATKNLEKIVNECNFLYKIGDRHLPEYTMTEEEAKKYATKNDLFLALIKEGLAKRKVKDMETYLKRLKKEISVLRKGDTIDYFLILHDIIKAMRDEDVLIGIGRGSAGGSLVAYLMDITQINPIDFDLIFERFLNEGRIGKLVERPAWEVETDDGKTIVLKDSDLLRVLRNGKETLIFAEDLKVGEEILKY